MKQCLTILLLLVANLTIGQKYSMYVGLGYGETQSSAQNTDVGDFDVANIGEPVVSPFLSATLTYKFSKPQWLAVSTGLAFEPQTYLLDFWNEGDPTSLIPSGSFGSGGLTRTLEYFSIIVPLELDISVAQYIHGYGGLHYWIANRKMNQLGEGYEFIDVVESSLLAGSFGISVGLGIEYKAFNLRYMYRERSFLNSFAWDGKSFQNKGVGSSINLELRYRFNLN